jgi:hypothetical protein
LFLGKSVGQTTEQIAKGVHAGVAKIKKYKLLELSEDNRILFVYFFVVFKKKIESEIDSIRIARVDG